MPKFVEIPSALISKVFSFSSFSTCGYLAAASQRMKYVSELPSSSPKVLDFDFSVPSLVSIFPIPVSSKTSESSESKEQCQLQNQNTVTGEVSKRLHHPEVLKCFVRSANNAANLDKIVACLSEKTIRSLLHADSSLREIEISLLDTKDKNKGVKKIYFLPLLSRLGYRSSTATSLSVIPTTPLVFMPAVDLLAEYQEKRKKLCAGYHEDDEYEDDDDDYDKDLSEMQINFTRNARDAAEAAANPESTITSGSVAAVNKKLEKLIFYRPGLSYEWIKEPIETLNFLPRLEALTMLKTDAMDLCPRLVKLLPPNLTDLTLSVNCAYNCQETNCSRRMKEQDWKQLGQLPLRRLSLYTENDLQEIYKKFYLGDFDCRFFKTTRKMMVNMALHLLNLQELHCAQVVLGALQVDPSEKSGPIKFENLRHFSYVACDINDEVIGGLLERFSKANNLIHCSQVAMSSKNVVN